jgi:hypothetical protein
VQHVGHRGSRLDGAFVLNKKCGSANQASTAGAVFNTVAEKSDRAGVVGVICIRVQRRVKLRARRNQSEHPYRQRTKNRDPAKSEPRFCVGDGRGHAAKQISIGSTSRNGCGDACST